MITVSGVINGTTVSIFYSYYKIYKSLKESTQNLNAHSIEDAAASSRRPATDIRLLKTSFTVFCVFLVTWGPVTAVVIVETAGSLIPREIFTVAIYLMFISSLVNPIICGIMNPPFQAAFKRALNFGRYGNNQISESSTGNRDKPWSRPRSLMHDGVILLLVLPESISCFLSYLELNNPCEVWATIFPARGWIEHVQPW